MVNTHKRQTVGRIAELWRYPVSSVGGERMETLDLDEIGVVGDRRFALIDADDGFAAAPEMHKKWRKALFLEAAYAGEHMPQITFPNGQTFAVTDRKLNECLSDYFGFSAAIATLDTSSPNIDFPTTQPRYPHSPVHFVTSTSMSHIANLCQAATIDSRRFRPTAVIATPDQDKFLEDKWVGQRLAAGSARFTADDRTKRCGMTFLAQYDHNEEPDILRNILRHNQRNFGINCSVTRPGRMAIGDDVLILK